MRIIVSDRTADPAARRFSVAHELGHFVLDHPTTRASELCNPGSSARRSDRDRERDYEVEANAFASEVLMPYSGKRVERDSVAWDFFAKDTIDDRAQPVPADAWLDTSAEVDIVEHAVASREFGTVLSLLWVPEAVAARLGMVA